MQPQIDLPIARPFAPPAARPRLTTGVLMAADALALLASALAAVALRDWAHGHVNPLVYRQIWYCPLPFLVAYAGLALYPAIALSPAEELRRLTLATVLVYLLVATAIFLASSAPIYSRGAFVIAVALSVVAVPMARAVLRRLCARRRWWGASAVVLGSGEAAEAIIRRLLRQPELGLKPVAVLEDDSANHGSALGVPVVGKLELAAVLAGDLHVPYAIVPDGGDDRTRSLRIIERYGKIFPHLIVVPDLFGSAIMWMTGRDLGGVLGFEVKQRLLLPGPRRTKRLFDLVVGVPVALASLPLVLLIAALVRLDSRGPALYAQVRIGQGGRRFRTWKFRSMVQDADALLERCLAADPELRAEWERDHKLRDDPRVTRVGRFLRRTSLDELPQIWNVMRGEMSLIGPRPIVQAEVERYLHQFHLYGKIKPGMSGLWQVSGRNDTSYEERIEYDIYYVRNWTVWLDLHILARTALVVLFGRGAY